MALEDFDKLKERLLDNKDWPLKYMFKFVVPNQDGKVEKATSFLPENAVNTFKHTKSLTFVSITSIANMPSADDIIIVLDKVAGIEGVISL